MQTKESATEKEIGTKETAQIKPLITRNTIRVVLSVEPASVQKDKKWQASLGENNAIDVAQKRRILSQKKRLPTRSLRERRSSRG